MADNDYFWDLIQQQRDHVNKKACKIAHTIHDDDGSVTSQLVRAVALYAVVEAQETEQPALMFTAKQIFKRMSEERMEEKA